MVIPVNNKRYLWIDEDKTRRGVVVSTGREGNGGVVYERRDFIPEHELVMLYGYWSNCKDGTEKSDYIEEA